MGSRKIVMKCFDRPFCDDPNSHSQVAIIIKSLLIRYLFDANYPRRCCVKNPINKVLGCSNIFLEWNFDSFYFG